MHGSGFDCQERSFCGAGPCRGNGQGTEDCPQRRTGLHQGSEQFFTGNVRIDPLYPANNDMRSSGGSVTFEPGARSNLAYSSCRTGADHHLRRGPDAGMGQARTESQAGRCRHLPCGRQALARGRAEQFHVAHLNLRREGTRPGRRVDGKGDRRTGQRQLTQVYAEKVPERRLAPARAARPSNSPGRVRGGVPVFHQSASSLPKKNGLNR